MYVFVWFFQNFKMQIYRINQLLFVHEVYSVNNPHVLNKWEWPLFAWYNFGLQIYFQQTRFSGQICVNSKEQWLAISYITVQFNYQGEIFTSGSGDHSSWPWDTVNTLTSVLFFACIHLMKNHCNAGKYTKLKSQSTSMLN